MNTAGELHRQAISLVDQVLHDNRAGIVSDVVTLRVLTQLCEQFSNQVILHILKTEYNGLSVRVLPVHVAARMCLERHNAHIHQDADELSKCLEWVDHVDA